MKTTFALWIILFAFAGPAFGGMAPYAQGILTNVEGNIVDVYVVFNPVMQEKGLHLLLETSTGRYVIHVCPLWWDEKQKFGLSKGESITVSGSCFEKKGEKNIYAAKIVRHDSNVPAEKRILELRDLKTGERLWFGRYRPESRDAEMRGRRCPNQELRKSGN